jgi:hypothetical protein
MTTGPVRRGAALLSALSAGIVSALVLGGPAVARDDGRPAATRAAPAGQTVTLVTGDKVTVTDLGGGKRTVSVERAPGAFGAVHTQVANGDVTVVPDEALPYLRAGTLDRRLFDVSALIRQGLGDRKSGTLPLIVTYAKGARTAALRGAARTRSLPSIDGAALDADKGRTFWRSSPASTPSARSGSTHRSRPTWPRATRRSGRARRGTPG